MTTNDAVITVQPADTGAALVNPDMGWTMHFYSNIPENYGSKLEPSDTLEDFPGLSTVYLRVPWAFLEPEEGEFNWALFDTPAQRWIAKGKRVAFRVTLLGELDAVRHARMGAEGRGQGDLLSSSAKGRARRAVLGSGLRAIRSSWRSWTASWPPWRARYDGNPNVAFIDVGSFGMWGEGHTVHEQPGDRASDAGRS